ALDLLRCVIFFFQAEDGIRDFHVTGVQTCALPISARTGPAPRTVTASPWQGNPRSPPRSAPAPEAPRTPPGTRRSAPAGCRRSRSEEHTSELQSREKLVCRLLLEKKKPTARPPHAA